MLHVSIRHKVKDYAAWKTVFDNFASTRKSFGEKTHHIFHQLDNPNDLQLLFEWDTLQNAEKFFASTELKSRMQSAGVIETPVIQFLKSVGQGSL